MPQRIQRHGEQDDEALEDAAVKVLHLDQVETVFNQAQEHDAEESAPNRPLATHDAGAAHDHRGDRDQLQSLAIIALGAQKFRSGDDSRDAGGKSTDAKGDRAHQVHVDAGQSRGFWVIARGKNVAPELGADEHEGQDEGQTEPDVNGRPDAQNVRPRQFGKDAIAHAHGIGLGDQQSQATEHEACGKGGDEGIDAQEGDEHAVEQAKQSTDEDADDPTQIRRCGADRGDIRPIPSDEPGHHAAHREDGASG